MMKWLLFFTIFASGLSSPQRADVNIKLDHLKNKNGQILVAIFKTKEGFPQKITNAYKLEVFKASASTITIKDLPTGKYSISIVHDENNNGKVDYNLFRVPKEGYGFSNVNNPGLYVPGFERTLVNITDDVAVKIPLYYFSL